MKKYLASVTALLLSFVLAVPVLAADVRLKQNLVLTGTKTLTVGGTSAFTGAATFSVPITKANVGQASKRFVAQAIFNGTIADSGTLKRVIVPGRAWHLKAADIAALTKPVGGTNTLAVEKVVAGSGTTLLNAATFDPTTITANGTAQALTLTATSADLDGTAADLLVVTLTTGTQSTDAVDLTVGLELELDD